MYIIFEKYVIFIFIVNYKIIKKCCKKEIYIETIWRIKFKEINFKFRNSLVQNLLYKKVIKFDIQNML